MQAMSKVLLLKKFRQTTYPAIVTGDLPLQTIDDLCIIFEENDVRYIQLTEEHLETEAILISPKAYLDDTLNCWFDTKSFGDYYSQEVLESAMVDIQEENERDSESDWEFNNLH
ncbi:hypothetical protein HDU92_005777 [Lobulomyces angularis]|nr:hypothetical protein HDU92_005777 [Lobulomyces angularis]